jgi:protein MpaA
MLNVPFNLARLGVLFSLMHIGCATSHRPSATQREAIEAPHRNESQTIGWSVEGRPIEAITLGGGPRAILYIATIHGDESAGTPLLRLFEQHVRAHPEVIHGCRVVLVPIANPDGFVRARRSNANGVDLNRNFAAANFTDRRRHGTQPNSEPESRALAMLIDDIQPSAIISIHQPLACIDYDGPAEWLAKAMSAAGRLPVKKIGAQPGSLGSFAGVERGIPIITLELPGSIGRLTDAALWNRFGPLLTAALQPDPR